MQQYQMSPKECVEMRKRPITLEALRQALRQNPNMIACLDLNSIKVPPNHMYKMKDIPGEPGVYRDREGNEFVMPP
jgi:hypothetical protein